MPDGWDYLWAYLAYGKLPPKAWCPFDDIAWLHLHFWSSHMIFLAYVLFPLCLLRIAHFAPSREYWLPPTWVIVMIGLFVASCGIRHELDNWSMFSGDYYLETVWMFLTGLVSLVTDLGLWLHGSDLKRMGRHDSEGSRPVPA